MMLAEALKDVLVALEVGLLHQLPKIWTYRAGNSFM
jgi:hypothetical protein